MRSENFENFVQCFVHSKLEKNVPHCTGHDLGAILRNKTLRVAEKSGAARSHRSRRAELCWNIIGYFSASLINLEQTQYCHKNMFYIYIYRIQLLTSQTNTIGRCPTKHTKKMRRNLWFLMAVLYRIVSQSHSNHWSPTLWNPSRYHMNSAWFGP